jgi:hypothetical protein
MDDGRYVLRVDRTWDDKGAVASKVEDAQFVPATPHDAYEVTIKGDKVTVTPLAGAAKTITGRVLSGARQTTPGTGGSAPTPNERRYDLDKDKLGGGELVIRGDEGEITIFGSGRPILSSERGKLLRR